VSNQVSEVLGRLLVRHRLISEEVYEKTLEVVLKEKKRHGEVLLNMGAITHDQLNESLTLQLKERLWDVFSWDGGQYHYQPLIDGFISLKEVIKRAGLTMEEALPFLYAS